MVAFDDAFVEGHMLLVADDFDLEFWLKLWVDGLKGCLLGLTMLQSWQSGSYWISWKRNDDAILCRRIVL